MDKYKKYMDSVEASHQFKDQLKELDRPKKAAVWQKYGAMAAALVLVLGLGALGIVHFSPQTELGEEMQGKPATEIMPEPMPIPSGGPVEWAPDTPIMGGYEVRDGEVASYYMLPKIEYGQMDELVQADTALPVGVYRRDLTQEELFALFGGEQCLSAHLNWSGYEVYAFAMLNRDGSLWQLYVGGSKGDTGYEHFALEVAPGRLPVSCCVYEQSVPNMIFGKEVMAESHDGANASYRRVSFMNETYGYRFEVTGVDVGAIEEMASRAVTFICTIDGMQLTNPQAGSEGERQPEPTLQPNLGDEMSTPAYDPTIG